MLEDRQHVADSTDENWIPLSALLSQALVAFTIEADNEFEHQMPHRTARYGSKDGRGSPWLISMAMWENCLRYLSEGGLTVAELQRQARQGTNLDGMRRWGYITIDPDTSGSKSKKPRADAVLRPTPMALRAQQVWRPICGEVEQRWRTRFGENVIDRLRQALGDIVSQVKYDLPDFLPIVGYGMFIREGKPGHERTLTKVGDSAGEALTPAAPVSAADLSLSALLAKALLVFAVQFERESKVSLAICANVLRVLGDQGVQVRQLPSLTGVSKEALSMATGFLEDRELAIVEPDSAGSRYKVIRLTPKGLEAKKAYSHLVADIEQRWRTRYGEQAITHLRDVLEQLVGAPDLASPLLEGLQPYPDGWRARVARPETLPHFPMVLHRGGYPDGA